MEHNVEEIRSLMIEKLDNQIDPEDELLLQRLITEQKSVQVLWEEMQVFFALGDGRKILERLNTQQEWKALNNELKRTKRKKAGRYIGFAVGAAAAIIAVMLYINLPRTGNDKLHAERAPKGILLQIGNGETIDLSGGGNEAIVAGDAHLQNNGKELTYKGGNSTQWSKITVPAGMDYKIKLSDSSVLWLNAATTARFPVNFAGKIREIEINGEAYLEVAKDPSRPFIVHLPGADVQVTGTAFNINSYDPGTVKVALVEGSVNMRTAKEAIGLKPGYQALASTGASIQVHTFDQRQVLSWMKGQYVFSNTPVQEIAQILQRLYNVEIVLDNQAVSRKCFTGIINKQKKLQDFLDDLTATAEVSYYFREDVLHFR